MYAVIKTGGKQYKVAKDQIVVVEKLAAATGDSVAFDQVLLVGEDEKTTLGAPTVTGAWREMLENHDRLAYAAQRARQLDDLTGAVGAVLVGDVGAVASV